MHDSDFHELVAWFEDPARAHWQKPGEVIASLGPLDGKTVANIGAGTGYFAFPLAKNVAKVIAIDIDQRFLDYFVPSGQVVIEVSRQEMRGNSQLLLSVDARVLETETMKTPVIVLLTNDNSLEDLVADALSEIGGVSHLTHAAGDALETICSMHNVDLAVIDFEHGPHGMTLLSAISTLREDLPVIAITRDDEEHVEELAYANGATACFPKQAVATRLAKTIRELSERIPEQVFA